MSLRPFNVLFACGVAVLAGCSNQPQKKALDDDRPSRVLTPDSVMGERPAPVPSVNGRREGGAITMAKSDTAREAPKPEIQKGTGQFINPDAAKAPVAPAGSDGQVVFNFENQPIPAVVKAILGDLLQENYTIAPNVGGNVTFSTSRPIRPDQAMGVLEMLLSWTGNTLVHNNGRYTVLQIKDAIPGNLTPRMAPPNVAKGYEVRVIPLKYVSPSEMAKLLKPYARADAIVSADTARSMMVLAGTATELENYQRTIDLFDVDWLKGMSIGVYTLQSTEVSKILPDLEKLFGASGESPLAGMFRFMPIESVNALAVITPQPEYLKQAEEWLHRLDRGGGENGTQIYVYDVKNVKAPDLAQHLGEIFQGRAASTSSRTGTSGTVAPGLRSASIGGGGAGGLGGNTANQMGKSSASSRLSSTSSATSSLSTNQAAQGAAPAAGGANTTGPGGEDYANLRITAVEENNQILVMATPVQWDTIQAAVRRLDIPPLQVQIETRILEVRLTGSLQFGVQWYLAGLIGTAANSAQANGQYPYPQFTGNSHDRHRVSLGATGNVGPTGDKGIFYSLLTRNFEVAINAMEEDGVARTLSAPSLVVMNNQEAEINVGDQIPVIQTFITPGLGTVTNTNSSTNGTVTNTFNTGSVQYLTTGVILNVKPRVNPGGLVYMDIQQQVSKPGPPSGSANGNPPISNREIATQVAVQSGETVLLGGLIREDDGTTDDGIPGLNRVPILGRLFGSRSKTRDRTELIVLITPRVIANNSDAYDVTEDYKRQFQSLRPLKSAQPAAADEPVPTSKEQQP